MNDYWEAQWAIGELEEARREIESALDMLMEIAE